jgi:hypothetical protein
LLQVCFPSSLILGPTFYFIHIFFGFMLWFHLKIPFASIHFFFLKKNKWIFLWYWWLNPGPCTYQVSARPPVILFVLCLGWLWTWWSSWLLISWDHRCVPPWSS